MSLKIYRTPLGIMASPAQPKNKVPFAKCAQAVLLLCAMACLVFMALSERVWSTL